MSKVSAIGLDLAKSVFQVHGVDAQGQVAERKRLRRSQVRKFFAGLPPCLVGMEACASAHYWARELSRLGHTVRLMPPAYVKPYVKTNKNDPNDAEGICEAVQRPNMRFVSVKTPEQQAVLQLHGARDLLVRQQVALSNQMRSVLAEHGIVLPQGHQVVLRRLPELLEDADNGLPMPVRHLLAALREAHEAHGERIEHLEHQIRAWHQGNAVSQRLATIPGIGVLTATALAASLGDGEVFRSARHLAAFLGLVPRQHSSGQRQCLGSISKRGNGYLRKLLIQGAHAVLRHVRRRMAAGQDTGQPWVEQLLARRPHNVVAVALANKMARMAWVLLRREQTWRSPAAA